MESDRQFATRAERPLRVIVPFNTPYLYGMERSVLELFSALRPEVEAHFVTAESFKRHNLPVIAGLERRGLAHSFLPDRDGGWPGFGKPRSLGEGIKLLWTTLVSNACVLRPGWNCDVLYLPSPRYIAAWCTAAAMRVRGRAVLYHCHDLRPSPDAMMFWKPLVTACVFSTHASRQLALERVPWLKGVPGEVLPLLLDVTAQPAMPEEQRRNIVYIGQVAHHKGIDLLIRAFAMVAPSHPSAELCLVGGVAADFERQLAEEISSSRVSDRIHVIGYRNDAQEFLRSASMYVQPSPPSRFLESFGRSVVEAMCAGVPVVCFKGGALPEIVADGSSGIVCRDESVEALAEAITVLLQNDSLRQHMGSGGQKRFAEHYAPGVVRWRWLKLFRELSCGTRGADVAQH